MKIGDKVVVKKDGAIHSRFICGEVVEVTSIGHTVFGAEGFYATNGEFEQLLSIDQVEMYEGKKDD